MEIPTLVLELKAHHQQASTRKERRLEKHDRAAGARLTHSSPAPQSDRDHHYHHRATLTCHKKFEFKSCDSSSTPKNFVKISAFNSVSVSVSVKLCKRINLVLGKPIELNWRQKATFDFSHFLSLRSSSYSSSWVPFNRLRHASPPTYKHTRRPAAPRARSIICRWSLRGEFALITYTPPCETEKKKNNFFSLFDIFFSAQRHIFRSMGFQSNLAWNWNHLMNTECNRYAPASIKFSFIWLALGWTKNEFISARPRWNLYLWKHVLQRSGIFRYDLSSETHRRR